MKIHPRNQIRSNQQSRTHIGLIASDVLCLSKSAQTIIYTFKTKETWVADLKLKGFANKVGLYEGAGLIKVSSERMKAKIKNKFLSKGCGLQRSQVIAISPLIPLGLDLGLARLHNEE